MTYVVKTSTIFFELGQVHGAGLDSQIMAGKQAAIWVKQGLLTHKQTRDVYSDWKAGSDSAVAYADALDASKNVISIFGTFLLPNVLKFGDIHDKALKMRAKLKAEGADLKPMSAYNFLVKVNRDQNKAKALLSDAELKAILLKAEKAEGDAEEAEAEDEAEATEKTLAERLGELAAMARKINDKFAPAGFENVIQTITEYTPAATVIPQVNRDAVTLQ